MRSGHEHEDIGGVSDISSSRVATVLLTRSVAACDSCFMLGVDVRLWSTT